MSIVESTDSGGNITRVIQKAFGLKQRLSISSTTSAENANDTFYGTECISKSCSVHSTDVREFTVLPILQSATSKFRVVKNKSSYTSLYLMKILKKSNIKMASQMMAIIHERFVLEGLASPRMITLMYAFHDQKNIYIVTSYFGQPFESLLTADNILPEEKIKNFCAQIAQGLDYLHKKNIIFRNVCADAFRVDDNQIQLIDFEHAIALHGGNPATPGGPKAIMAPEMFMDRSYSYSVDWWALGLFVFHCCFGALPLDISNLDDPKRVLEKFVVDFPSTNSLTQKRVEYSNNCKEFMRNLLQRNVSFRLGNALGGLGFEKEIAQHPWLATLSWNQLGEPSEPVLRRSRTGSFRKMRNDSFISKFSNIIDVAPPVEADFETAVSLEEFEFEDVLVPFFPSFNHEIGSKGRLLTPPVEEGKFNPKNIGKNDGGS